MQNTIIAVVVVLLIIGVGYFFVSSNTPEFEETDTSNEEDISGNASKGMPVPGMENVDEMIVTPETNSQDQIYNSGSESAVQISVSGQNFSFSPSTLRVKKGEKVMLTFTAQSGFHDFVIDEFNVRTKQLNAPGTQTVEFVADKVGQFEYYCSVGSHRQMGMKGTLVVTE